MKNKDIILRVLRRYKEILKHNTMQRTLTEVLNDQSLRECFAEDLAHEIGMRLSENKSRQESEIKIPERICLN